MPGIEPGVSSSRMMRDTDSLHPVVEARFCVFVLAPLGLWLTIGFSSPKHFVFWKKALFFSYSILFYARIQTESLKIGLFLVVGL